MTLLWTLAWADMMESTPQFTVLAVKALQSATAWKGRLRVFTGRDMINLSNLKIASLAASWGTQLLRTY